MAMTTCPGSSASAAAEAESVYEAIGGRAVFERAAARFGATFDQPAVPPPGRPHRRDRGRDRVGRRDRLRHDNVPDDRRRRLSARARADMLAGVAVKLQRWPIIGRRPELEVFERALGSGELAGLVIYGRAGVGKTRLADECRLQAAAAGHPAERVAGSRTTALVPLGAVAALVAGGLGHLGPTGRPAR